MSWLTLPDGARLRVADRGPARADGRPPVVLVHGWKGSHRLWDPLAVELVERGHRVVAFDLRGMGESHKPGRGEPYDFDVLAADLGAVLAAHELEDATLVGWSMGCSVSLRYLELVAGAGAGDAGASPLLPEPVGGARVGRLVLVNGPLRLTRAEDFPHAMSEAQFERYLRELAAGWPASERAFQAESVGGPGADPAVVDWLYGIALQTPLDAALTIVRAQMRLDQRAFVAALPVPVLAAYATGDPYYPTSLGQWIADTAPDGRLRVFDRSTHGTPFERAAALAHAISELGEETAR
jgi:non-heme chloroperoxidase